MATLWAREKSPPRLNAEERLRWRSDAWPKSAISPPFDRPGLVSTSQVLDYHTYGFGDEAGPGTLAGGEPHNALVQTRQHECTFARDGVLNCLGVFIWVDLGVGAPPRVGGGTLDESAGVASEDGAGEAGEADEAGEAGEAGEGAFEHRFPFGAATSAPAEGGKRLNDFTSLCTAGTMRERTHVTNWMNPLLLLPQPTLVRKGERLLVVTRAAADSVHPSYSFELTLLPNLTSASGTEAGGASGSTKSGGKRASASGGRPIGTVEVSFAEIYPHYDDDAEEGEEGEESEEGKEGEEAEEEADGGDEE